MNKMELLKSIGAFEEMSDQQLVAIQERCEELDFRKDEKLFSEGDDAQYVWNVIEGRVDLRFETPDKRPTSQMQTISSIEVDDKNPEAKVIGWSCFVPPYKMRLSAYCVTDACKIVRIKKDALINLFKEDPLMGYRFYSYMITVVGTRFHQFQDHIAKNLGEDLMSGW